MRRVTTVFLTTTVVIATIMVASPLAAMGAASEDPLVFIPPQKHGLFSVVPPGTTVSCTCGPPFTLNFPDPTAGTCSTSTQPGPPAGLTCNIPATVTFIVAQEKEDFQGNVCYAVPPKHHHHKAHHGHHHPRHH